MQYVRKRDMFTRPGGYPAVTPLSSLPYPVGTTMQPQSSPNYADGNTITGSDGIVRLTRVTDPLGSGRNVYLHRIVRQDAVNTSFGVVRSEKVWIDFISPVNYYMVPGNDYWMSFAILGKSGEWPSNVGAGAFEEFIFFQVHSETPGLSNPSPALAQRLGTGSPGVYFEQSYATASDGAVELDTYFASGNIVGAASWTKFVIHFRPGYDAAQSPRMEVWRKDGGGAYTKTVDNTSFNTYNTTTNGSYARIGFYHYRTSYWQSAFPTVAAYLTTLYWGRGANLFSAADAALQGF